MNFGTMSTAQSRSLPSSASDGVAPAWNFSKSWLMSREAEAPPYYWIDIFAVNQHASLPPWKCDSGLTDCPGCAAKAAAPWGI